MVQKSIAVCCDPALSQGNEANIRTKEQGRDHLYYTPAKGYQYLKEATGNLERDFLVVIGQGGMALS